MVNSSVKRFYLQRMVLTIGKETRKTMLVCLKIMLLCEVCILTEHGDKKTN